MRKLLVDNNVWVALEAGYPDVGYFIRDAVIKKDKFYTNMVITMELLSHFEVEINASIRRKRESYLTLASINYEIDELVARKAGEIRRKAKLAGRSVPKGPDALIAATAIIHGLTVVSNNDKDFIWAEENFHFRYINPIRNQEDYSEFMKKRQEEASETLRDHLDEDKK